MSPVPRSEVWEHYRMHSCELWGTHLKLRGQQEATTDKPVRDAGGLARVVTGGMEMGEGGLVKDD